MIPEHLVVVDELQYCLNISQQLIIAEENATEIMGPI